MHESSLLVLAVSFLMGFVLFKKDKSAVPDVSKKERSNRKGASSQSYSHQGSESKLSGVSKYLNEKEGLNIGEESSKESGVAKYLASKEISSLSGVSKYMAKQSMQAEQKAKDNISGVEKYLKNKK